MYLASVSSNFSDNYAIDRLPLNTPPLEKMRGIMLYPQSVHPSALRFRSLS